MADGYYSIEFVGHGKNKPESICATCSMYLCCVYCDIRDKAGYVTKCDEYNQRSSKKV